MNLNISGHHMNMTDALRDYVTSKMERIERRFDHVIDGDVVLEVKKHHHTAEATIKMRGTTLHATDTKEDMYTAIDGMIAKLDRQTIRHKEKSNRHQNRPSGNVGVEAS